jgi:hypothetical protein
MRHAARGLRRIGGRSSSLAGHQVRESTSEAEPSAAKPGHQWRPTQQSSERKPGAARWDKSVEGASGLEGVPLLRGARRKGPGDAGGFGFGQTARQSDRERHRARHLARGRPKTPKRVEVRRPLGNRTARPGEVTRFEVGDMAPTVSPLEAGDAGNGYSAPAHQALGSSLRVSASESPAPRRWSQRAQAWSSGAERSNGYS